MNTDMKIISQDGFAVKSKIETNFTFIGPVSSSFYPTSVTVAPNGDIYLGGYGDIYKQAGGTGDYIPLGQTTQWWNSVTAAYNGDIYAISYNGSLDIHKQSGGSGNFNALSQANISWSGLAAAPNGNIYAIVPGQFGDIYMQTNGAGNFNALGKGSQIPLGQWAITVAPNGNVYVSVQGGDIYVQTNGAGDFHPLGVTHRYYYNLAASPNGNIYASDYYGKVYMQTNGVGDFIPLSTDILAQVQSSSYSENGFYGVTQTYIYVLRYTESKVSTTVTVAAFGSENNKPYVGINTSETMNALTVQPNAPLYGNAIMSLDKTSLSFSQNPKAIIFKSKNLNTDYTFIGTNTYGYMSESHHGSGGLTILGAAGKDEALTYSTSALELMGISSHHIYPEECATVVIDAKATGSPGTTQKVPENNYLLKTDNSGKTVFQVKGAGTVGVGDFSQTDHPLGLLHLISDSSSKVTQQLACNVGRTDATEIDGSAIPYIGYRTGKFDRYVNYKSPYYGEYSSGGIMSGPVYTREDCGVLDSSGYLILVGNDATTTKTPSPMSFPNYAGHGFLCISPYIYGDSYDDYPYPATAFSFSAGWANFLPEWGLFTYGDHVTFHDSFIPTIADGLPHLVNVTTADTPNSICLFIKHNKTDRTEESIPDDPCLVCTSSLVLTNNTTYKWNVSYWVKYSAFPQDYFGWLYD